MSASLLMPVREMSKPTGIERRSARRVVHCDRPAAAASAGELPLATASAGARLRRQSEEHGRLAHRRSLAGGSVTAGAGAAGGAPSSRIMLTARSAILCALPRIALNRDAALR